MTFFESGGTDSARRRPDDPFARLHRARGRRRRAAAGLVAGLVLTGLGGAFLLAGPERVMGDVVRQILGRPEAPAADLLAVADKAFLTEEGRALLYASRPRVGSIGEVEEFCARAADRAVLGCYSLRGIIAYQPPDPRVADAAVTTLAHELLHAAYDELGAGEVIGVDALLDAEIARVPADDPVHGQIAGSVGDHPELRSTELFAYLGSQVMPEGGLAPELEQVYARWFADRAALVGVHRRVEQTIAALDAELSAALDELAAAEGAAAAERAQIDADRWGHEVARAAYNADADRYNALPATERPLWTDIWTADDGTVHSTPLGDALARRLAELDRHRGEIDARVAALEAAETALRGRRDEVTAQRADLLVLLRAAFPGETFE